MSSHSQHSSSTGQHREQPPATSSSSSHHHFATTFDMGPYGTLAGHEDHSMLPVFDSGFELPIDESFGLVEPGAFEDFNPLPSLPFDSPLFPPLSPGTVAAIDPTFGLSLQPAYLGSTSVSGPTTHQSLFSTLEASALTSFLTSPFVPEVGPPPSSMLAPTGTTGAVKDKNPFAGLARARGTWDFNPVLPAGLPKWETLGGLERMRISGGSRERSSEGSGPVAAATSSLSYQPSPRSSSATCLPAPPRHLSSASTNASRATPRAASRSGGGHSGSSRRRPSASPAHRHSMPHHDATASEDQHSTGSSTRGAEDGSADRSGVLPNTPPEEDVVMAEPGVVVSDEGESEAPEVPTSDGDISPPLGAGSAIFKKQQGGGRSRSDPPLSDQPPSSLFGSHQPSSPLQPPGLIMLPLLGHHLPPTDSGAPSDLPLPPLRPTISPPLPPSAAAATPGSSLLSHRPSPEPEDGRPSQPKRRRQSAAVLPPLQPNASSAATPSTHTSASPLPLPPPPPPPPSATAKGKGRVTAPVAAASQASSRKQQSSAVASAMTDDDDDAAMDDGPSTADVSAKAEGSPSAVPASAAGGKGGAAGGAKLTPKERRANHILSEQRRRDLIRISYAEITHILASSTLAPLPPVPQQELNAPPRRGGGRGKGGSKAGMLRKTVGLIRWLSEGNQWMEEEVGRLEREAGGG